MARLGDRVRARRTQPGAGAAPAQPALVTFIDVYWCDASGTYLQGWLTALEVPISETLVRVGALELIVERSARPDILPHYPAAVDTDRAGFSVYIPGRPGAEIWLVARHPNGTESSVKLELPDHPLPVLPDEEGSEDAFWNFPREIPDGPILAVGIRSGSEELLAAQISRLAGREVVGFDIHAGIGIDVVGDAHRLTDYFGRDSFAGVFSVSVVEHLVKPWLFAVQCAAVLKPGGRMFHEGPWAWPTHAAPTDFWRFSPEGLQSLFGPELGLRTIGSGTRGSARMFPGQAQRADLRLMPTTPSALSSWIEVEKVGESAPELFWPYDDAAGESIATGYPVDGLGTG